MAIDFTDRHTYVGASEVSAILGLSRWETPLSIWTKKTQMLPPSTEENIPAEVGNELEDYVARLFTRRTGKKVHRVNEAFEHKKYPFIKCHLDRKVEGERAILQCKTCSAHKYKEWEGDEIPIDYIIQEYVELACSGYDKAYIAVLIGNTSFVWREITRDDKTINDIISKTAKFWNDFVIPKIMPKITNWKDNEVLADMYPKAQTGTLVQLKDDANIIIESIESLKEDKKMLEKEITKYQAQLKSMIKENELGTTGIYNVFWKNISKPEYTVKAMTYRQLDIKKIDKGDK